MYYTYTRPKTLLSRCALYIHYYYSQRRVNESTESPSVRSRSCVAVDQKSDRSSFSQVNDNSVQYARFATNRVHNEWDAWLDITRQIITMVRVPWAAWNKITCWYTTSSFLRVIVVLIFFRTARLKSFYVC